jgi:integrase
MPVRFIKKRWAVDFRFGGERCRKRSPLNTRPGAIAYEMFLKKEACLYGSITSALRANSPENRMPCPTLAEFTPRWFAGYVTVNNRPKEQAQKRRVFKRHILPEFGALRMCDIGYEEIEVYKGKKRAAGLAAKTINNHLAVLHRCLTCAKEWKVLRTEVPRVPLLRAAEPTFHFLSDDDCSKLLAMAPGGVPRAMILMGLRTGLRFCELAALRWDDVDLSLGSVTVCRSMVGGDVSAPKSNRIRHVPLTTDLVHELRALPLDGELVFTRAGRMITYRVAWKMLDDLSRAAGIEHVSWHDLRHTFASQLVARGASLLSVQKLLGHSDIQVTMRYSHLGKDALRGAIALLENSFHEKTGNVSPIKTGVPEQVGHAWAL